MDCIVYRVAESQTRLRDFHSLTHSLTHSCTPMFIAALFIIARSWKQPRCPSADEWIRKLWYIYTMEYYSAVEKNSFEINVFVCVTERH